MSEEISRAVAIAGMSITVSVFIICVAFSPHSGKPKTDDRIERLEQKIDQIHRVVVGGK